jgi:hypothetical protein
VKIPDHVQEALEEALRELELLDQQENDRRRSADAKLGALQGTIGVIVTLIAGSVSITVVKGEPSTVWSLLTYIAFSGGVAFFVWAAQQVRKGSDLQPLYTRTASGVCKVLQAGGSKRTLLLDAIADYGSIITENQKITNYKLTWYRASIENIIKGVYCLVAVPVLLFISLAVSTWQNEHPRHHQPTPVVPKTVMTPKSIHSKPLPGKHQC